MLVTMSCRGSGASRITAGRLEGKFLEWRRRGVGCAVSQVTLRCCQRAQIIAQGNRLVLDIINDYVCKLVNAKHYSLCFTLRGISFYTLVLVS